jgi:hypothetical protein
MVVQAQKNQPEIFLTCGFYDRSNSSPFIFLFSPKNKIDFFGQPSKSTNKIDSRYWVSLKETTNNEYVFIGNDSEAAHYADLGRKKYYGDTIKINRKSLDITRRSNEPDPNSHFYNMNFSYKCDILKPETSNIFINQILEERFEKAKNVKPNKI